MIQLDAVSHAWGSHRVLNDISCSLTERRIGLIGANGSGKSSFARLINGLLMPDTGVVKVGSLDTRRDTAAVRRQVGFVFQNPDVQIIYPTVEEDLAFGLDNLDLPASEKTQRIERIISRLSMQAWRDSASHSLSGGQKQLLALASVLVMEPGVIVLDEPTTLLDLANTQRLRQLLAGLPQQLVLVTHDFDDLQGFDRVLVIDQGRIFCDASPAESIDAYRALVAQRLSQSESLFRND